MQLEVIFAGNRLATRVLWSRDNSVKRKTESGNRFCILVVQCSKLSKIVMFTNLKYRETERQRKRESRRQASEAQREKGRQTARARDKKRRHFFVGRTTWKFCCGGEKMKNASGHQGENERQWKKSDQEHVRHFLLKTCNWGVSGSFTLWPYKTMAKKCRKKVCCTFKVAFLLIRPIVVFSPFSLP